ncbi:MAG: hypothetical protein PVH00_15080 [Gemmatimonadota bacterium]|jgi:hypothetical protein
MKPLVLAILLAAAGANAQVTPTTEWISVWSQASTLNGQALPAGSRVQALDPDGVVCGETTVAAAGQFGLMPVYRDDPLTVADEGAEPGDVIRFNAAGFAADTAVPVVWEYNGQTTAVDLHSQGVLPTPEWLSIWSDGTVVAGAPVPPGARVRAYDPSGVLCGEAVAHGPGLFGLMPVYRDDPLTPDFDEGADPGDELRFDIDGAEAAAAAPVLWTFAGDVLDVDLTAAAVPTLLVASSVRWSADRVVIRWTLFSDANVRAMTVWRDLGGPEASVVGEVPPGALDHEIQDGATPRGKVVTYTLAVDTEAGGYTFELGTVSTPALAARLTAAPNPTRAGTTITIVGENDGVIRIVDVAGREVRTLRASGLSTDRASVFWDGRDGGGRRVAGGVYFVTARVKGRRLVYKTVIAR